MTLEPEPEPFAVAGAGRAARRRGEGEGPPIVLCHGITATRRYVVHGSKALPRPAIARSPTTRAATASPIRRRRAGLWIPGARRPTSARWSTRRSARAPFVLAGHSMGAHTLAAYALEHPERLAGLVVIGPVYLGAAVERGGARLLGRAGRRARARRRRGLRRGLSTMTSTRAGANGAAVHPRAAARAPPSRGGGAGAARGAALAAVRGAWRSSSPRPAGAGRRQPRRGRPRAPVRGRRGLRRALPARAWSARRGESPLAWQGGRLSREIAASASDPRSAVRRMAARLAGQASAQAPLCLRR